MKEITRIHLAKTAFSVEIDAKKSLEKYLNSIQKNMHAAIFRMIARTQLMN